MALARPLAARRVGRWTRLSLAFQVALVLGLSLGTALLAIEASRWGPLHVRLDLSLSGRNTLDPALSALIEALPEPAEVETFFQPLPGPFQPIWLDARNRALGTLTLAAREHPDALRLVRRDLESLEAMRARLEALGLEERAGANAVVVGVGERREVLHLFPDFASLGRNQAREPVITSFQADLALATALARASSGDRPRVSFTTGHGEPDLFGQGPGELDRLRAELEADGFRVEAWNLAEERRLPEDVEVLAVVAPQAAFYEEELELVRAFVARGGRLLVALGDLQRGRSATQLLSAYGLEAVEGVVCEPVLDGFGRPAEGVPQCMVLRVLGAGLSSQHPVTAPLFESRRSVEVHASRSFERGAAPEGGLLLELLSSSRGAWRDLPSGGAYDFALDPVTERTGPFALALSSQFQPPEAQEARRHGDEIHEARVAGLGSALVLANQTFAVNRDFALNLFNWLSQRDYRLNVSLEDPEEGRIDVRRGGALPWLNRIGVWGLPALCGLLGLLTAWRRSR